MVEADLQRFYHVELADFWRGELSLRRLSVLVYHLPPGSSTWSHVNRLEPGWATTDLLLADLFQALTGEKHPARPTAKDSSRYAKLRARLEAQKARHSTTT